MSVADFIRDGALMPRSPDPPALPAQPLDRMPRAEGDCELRMRDNQRMRGPYPDTRSPLRDLDLAALIGQPVPEARARIEALGGELRTGSPGQPFRGNLNKNRVTVVQVDGIITVVYGFA